MYDWHCRADIDYWKGEKALREGKKEDAVAHFRKAVELNVPGETWPLLEAQFRLKELGVAEPAPKRP